MRSFLISLFIAFIALAGISVVIGELSQERQDLSHEAGLEEVMSPVVAKIVALDFQGLFSDLIFFKAYMFYGGKILRTEKLTEKEWEWFGRTINASTDMDPFFNDPYYLGSTALAWQADKIDEADALLEKGVNARAWDWTLPYYLGFNYFYFKHDNRKASQFLMEAAKRPGGGGGLVPSLAARLAQAGGETESAIDFLDNILRNTHDEPTRYIYGLRLNALRKVFYLERATELYRNRFKRFPHSLDELVKKGIIHDIPTDPYGGTFYIIAGGKIKTTSNFIVQRK